MTREELMAAGTKAGRAAFVPATAGSKAGGGLKARPTRLLQFVSRGEDSTLL